MHEKVVLLNKKSYLRACLPNTFKAFTVTDRSLFENIFF